MAAGIQKEQIFIIDTKSEVHNLADCQRVLTYRKISTQIHQYFPKHESKIVKMEFPEPIKILKKRKIKNNNMLMVHIE